MQTIPLRSSLSLSLLMTQSSGHVPADAFAFLRNSETIHSVLIMASKMSIGQPSNNGSCGWEMRSTLLRPAPTCTVFGGRTSSRQAQRRNLQVEGSTGAAELRPLGSSDLKVSKCTLGTMTWGSQNTEAEAHEQLSYALDQGINFIDTAEVIHLCHRVLEAGPCTSLLSDSEEMY